jgi:NAD+ kinase
MSQLIKTIKRVIIAAHPQVPEADREAAVIASFLEERGIQVMHGSLYDEVLRQRIKEEPIDLLIALGGDGTMLRAGHLCAPQNVPILGINLGRFGFLIEIHHDQWRTALPQLLGGDFWLERRMMLCAQQWRDDEVLGSWDVVNEAVVSRGEIMRPIHLNTYVDGRFLTTYVADGVIVSTPTGSTAYALAAGGPILPPELRNILLGISLFTLSTKPFSVLMASPPFTWKTEIGWKSAPVNIQYNLFASRTPDTSIAT